MKANRVNFLFLALAMAALMLPPVMMAHPAGAQDAAPAKTKKTPPPSLWVVNTIGRSAISIFPAARLLKKTGTVGSAGISLDANGSSLDGLTFDSGGDLWLSFCAGEDNTGYVAELSAAALRHLITTGGGQFTTVIEDPAAPDSPEYLTCPRGLGFDIAGNLWTETEGGSATGDLPALIEYSKAELGITGLPVGPTPAAFIETPSILSSLSPALAFDKGGNLWLSGGVISTEDPSAEQETVAEYTADQLATGTQTDPGQTLIVADTSLSGAFNAPSSIIFDATGNLWMAFALDGDGSAGGVEMFAAADFGGSGTSTPTPAITLGSAPFQWSKVTLQSIADPDGLAFDSAGDLWVANQSQLNPKLGRGSLVEFSALQLASANPVPVNLDPVRAILASKSERKSGSPDRHHVRTRPALATHRQLGSRRARRGGQSLKAITHLGVLPKRQDRYHKGMALAPICAGGTVIPRGGSSAYATRKFADESGD